MKFNILQQDLMKSLYIMEQGLNNKTIIDVLKGIKIIAKNNQITFITSKSDLALTYKINCENIEQEGQAIVYGTQFINIIKQIGDKDTLLKVQLKDNLLNIQTTTSKIKLVTLPIGDYPETYFNNTSSLVSINKDFLSIAYNKAKYSVANNPSKLILTGINLDFNNQALNISSTDSKRLSFINYPKIDNYENNIVINKNLFANIIKVLEIIDEEEIKIAQDNTQLYIETETLQLKGRLIDGEFPAVVKLIPQNIKFSFEVVSRNLEKTLSMMLSISEKNNNVVTLEYIQNELFIKFFVQEFGEIEEKIELDNLIGTPFKIAFDPLFVLDALHSLSTDKIRLSFEAETSAFKIEDCINENNIQVISPIRIS